MCVRVGGDDGAQLAIGTDKINDISQGCNHSFMCMCVQEKREEYHRQQRQKEEEELRKKKQIQREKVKKTCWNYIPSSNLTPPLPSTDNNT